MPRPARTSLTLMARIADCREDQAVWGEFVEIYGTHVVRWCRSFGLNEDDARDLSQNVLLRFWRQAKVWRYDPRKRFRSYLRRITETAWADWQSSIAIGAPGRGGSELLRLLCQVPAREDLISRLENAFDQELFQRAMVEVKLRVEPHTWQAFELLALASLSGQEVAERLGMSVHGTYMARHSIQRMIRETVDRLEREICE